MENRDVLPVIDAHCSASGSDILRLSAVFEFFTSATGTDRDSLSALRLSLAAPGPPYLT
jgi:hypothetical protein